MTFFYFANLHGSQAQKIDSLATPCPRREPRAPLETELQQRLRRAPFFRRNLRDICRIQVVSRAPTRVFFLRNMFQNDQLLVAVEPVEVTKIAGPCAIFTCETELPR